MRNHATHHSGQMELEFGNFNKNRGLKKKNNDYGNYTRKEQNSIKKVNSDIDNWLRGRSHQNELSQF